MRVLLFTDRYLPRLSGPEVASHGFLAGLVAIGHTATAVTGQEGPPGARRERVLDGVRVLHSRSDPTFARYLETERPNVVLVQLAWVPDCLRACAAARVPCVVLCHAPACCRRAAGAPPAALYVFPSSALADEATVNPQIVIPPPIDRERLKAPAAERWAVTAVNLAAPKGGDLFAALARACPDRRFLGVLGGYGDQVQPDLPNVTLRPNTADLGAVYAESRVVLLPSNAESFGMVGVEAQAAGVPVIASDLPALRESLGAGALFVPPRDVAGWRAALESLDDPARWRALAEAGLANAGQYGAERSARALVEALLHVAEGQPGKGWRSSVDSRVEAGAAPLSPLVCDRGAPGQNAFTGALVRELGFAHVPFADVEGHLAAGRPVLVNGWFDDYNPLAEKHPGLLHAVWHSGWAGSGMMGEGVGLLKLLSHAGKIGIFWLERRDVLPPGARHLHPVWSPSAIQQAGGVEKQPRAVMAALHGKFPTSPKNVLAAVVGAADAGGVLHVGQSSVTLPAAGPVVASVLARCEHQIHETLDRPALLRLLASMEVLVHPSLSETWPGLIIEAAYVGTPAVISDVVSWSPRLSPRAQALCIARPATSSAEIARLTRHLLDCPEDREYLAAEQRRVLDELLPEHVREAAEDLRAAGFSVQDCAPPDLTVFVLTTGEPSTPECLAKLAAQDCRFRLEMVENVAPMDRAFQTMLDRCETPLFVQVDADMLLRPGALRDLRAMIEGQPEDVAFCVAWLWGDDVGRPIQGVKVYRHDICRRFPYEASLSCEVTQIERMQAAGYRYAVQDQPEGESGCMGLHFACQTPAMTFRRWKRLAQKHRRLPTMGWVGDHLPLLLSRSLRDPSPVNRAALLGASAGLSTPIDDAEMDYRQPDPEFVDLWRHFGIGEPHAYLGTETAVAAARRVEDVRHLVGGTAPPAEVVLYLTDKCNHACPFCKRQLAGKVEGLDWIAPGAPAPRQDMEPELVRLILKQFPSIKSACLAGFGEPLCHPLIDEIVRLLADGGVSIGLITNGSLLYHHREMVATWPLTSLSVSLNAVTPDAHRAASGCGTWSAVLQGVRHFAQETAVNVGVSFVCHRGNVRDVPALVDLARDLGVRFVHVVNLLPHGDPEDPWFLSHVLTDTCLEARMLDEYRRLPGAEIVKVWPALIDMSGEPPRKCQSPFTTLGVNSWGHTSLCRRVQDPIAFGGEHFQAPEMWTNVAAVGLRMAMAGEAPLPDRCRRCFGCWIG